MPSAVGMAPKMTKNQMRRAKKKEQKKTQQVSPVQHEIRINEKLTFSQVTPTPEPEKIPEAVQEPAAALARTEEEDEDDILKPEVAPLDISEDDPNYAMYKDIMDKFGTSAEEEEAAKEANAGEKGEVFFDDDDDIPDEEEEGDKEQKLSKKKRKERDKLSVAEMRDAVLEKQNEASLKQKQRERVQPKMGKLDIDYQKLYEAFFVRQTKPELTRYGEVYYEGKEYETNLKHLRPGELSDELKEALNIPPGAPPPWLINQQRFGPPPSYPSLKIPGLNAPPPPGGAWGFHPGGYGKPPVDEFNRPLYGGDIFGVLQPQVNNQAGEPIERTLWGELQAPEEESEEEESEDEEEEGDEEDIGAGLQTPSGLETPGGMASTVPSEYPGDMSVGGDFDLRKQKRGTETEESSAPRSAYTVIPERQIRAEGFFGGERAYDVRGAQNAHLPVLGQEDESRKRKKPGDVDVALNPDSLLSEDGISKEELQRTYEQSKKVEKGAWDQEDLSDMIAQESRKRQKRDEEKRGEKRERSYRF